MINHNMDCSEYLSGICHWLRVGPSKKSGPCSITVWNPFSMVNVFTMDLQKLNPNQPEQWC